MGAQWDGLLMNLGDWRGAFVQLDPQTGQRTGAEPSLVSLQSHDGGKTVVQRIRRAAQPVEDWDASNQPLACDRQLVIASLGRSFMALPSGAFSQGSTQLGPFSEFGAELGLLMGDRRVRLVERFDREGRLEPLTLMAETRGDGQRAAAPVVSSPAELLDVLVGTWHGEATTVYPDFSPTTTGTTTLTVARVGNAIEQTLTFADRAIASCGHFDGRRIRFGGESDRPGIQVLLLENGISANCPERVVLRRPFVLELGWLVSPTERRRLVRTYAPSGEWVSLTEVVEHKQ